MESGNVLVTPNEPMNLKTYFTNSFFTEQVSYEDPGFNIKNMEHKMSNVLMSPFLIETIPHSAVVKM